MIEGALEADGRIAAKNAVKIRAALRELANYKQLFLQYQETHPVSTDNLAKDRARARAWAIMNVTQLRTEALESALWRMWAEAYVLGDVAASEWLRKTRELNKADDEGYVDWSKWQPGDRAASLMLRRPKAFQQILDQTGASIRGMTKTSVTDIGNSLADAVELGLDAERAALLISRHVASPARALTIAITEQNRVMSAATIQRYKEAELEKMEWHVSDPCAKCAQNSGVEVPIGTSFPSGNTQPPAHPHCRCVLLPVIPGMTEPGIEQGNITAPVTTPSGAIEQKPMQPQKTETPTSWTPMTPERWVERRQAERIKNGFEPYTGNQLKILQDQANDATAMWERGPHVIRWDKSSTKIDQPHVDAFMQNFDLAISKLPEWRRFDENGVERGYAAILSAEASGNTLAYTYLGNNTIWFSNTTIMRSLDAPGVERGLTPTGHKMPAQHQVNENLYTIAHELGHTVDSNANNQIRGRFTGPLRRKFADLWSRYSRQDPDEAYAEVFAQWLVGEHNALTDVYAKKFGWNLTAQEYKEQIEVQWVGNLRNQNIGG